MVSRPRIITVDPIGVIARNVRAAMDLLDFSVIQIDVPTPEDALDELDEKVNLVISAFKLGGDMQGFEFALRVKQAATDASMIIVADEDDPDNLDEETAAESPFVYLSRPLDIHQFLRVITAGLESHDMMIDAMRTPIAVGGTNITSPDEMGPVPMLDVNAAKGILEGLQSELGAMSILLSTRKGETLLEVGTTGFIDSEELSRSIVPVMQTNMGIKDIVGGQVTSVQFYDGDEYDVFVLSVGLHHFVCVVFEGQMGARQQGFVNRFGRKAVEDLIGLIGAGAFFIMPSAPKEEPTKRPAPHKSTPAKTKKEEEPVELAPAELDLFDDQPEPEPQVEQLEPIAELDLDAVFGTGESGELDESMFDLDNIEELTRDEEKGRKGTFSWDDAIDAGLIKGGNN
jgi:hypothetical protein